MQKRRSVAAPTPIYEDLFIQRYERLLTWALQLTDHDRELAEDLVHDIFIQFTLSQPDLSTIDNLEGYLRVMLRNMHLSQVRRSTRIRENASAIPEISLINHDSMESGLRAVEERTVAHVQHELRRICQYASIRKETSKAGSVLILRFFHGYYPSEIAKILRVSRGAVDEFLSIARAEARAFLTDPNSLAFMAAGKVSGPSASASEQTTEDLVRELRAFIFGPQDPDCLPPEKLRELYLSDQGSGPGAALLCHVVSCRRCLDEVNRVLDLPPLSARNLTDTLQKEKRPKNNNKDGDGSSGTSSGGGGFVERYRRRLKETFEHRPKELRISVNGIILGAHNVSSELSKQTISVNLEERIGFVEILSEKEVRLLFAVVEPPPDGPAERKERVSLSDGRTLELTLSFSESRPHLHVVYHDPLFQLEGAEQVSSPKEAREAGAPSQDGTEGSAEATGLLNPIRRLRQRLMNWSFWLRTGHRHGSVRPGFNFSRSLHSATPRAIHNRFGGGVASEIFRNGGVDRFQTRHGAAPDDQHGRKELRGGPDHSTQDRGVAIGGAWSHCAPTLRRAWATRRGRLEESRWRSNRLQPRLAPATSARAGEAPERADQFQ